MQPLSQRFCARDALTVARHLLGKLLVHRTNMGISIGRIIETEAYDETDPASHSYRGMTERSTVMFGPAGRAYVYRSYGIHWCMNVVAGREGCGAAVLIRALEPVRGAERMASLRGLPAHHRDVARGPGRLTQALGINGTHNGADLLTVGGLWLAHDNVRYPDEQVAVTPRIGISKAVEAPWRFFVAGNRFVSGKTRFLTAPQGDS